ncbi:MAG TPA: hypothetical protein VEM40_11015, partial [Nitrospirota bacterium]|nr:hypothetical protein [Nitrospirota bacterium]
MKLTNYSKKAEVYAISAVLLTFLYFFLRLEIMIFSSPVEILFSSATTPKVGSDNQSAIKSEIMPITKSSVNKAAVLANSLRGRSNAKPVINSDTRPQAKSAFKPSAGPDNALTAGSGKAPSAGPDNALT